MERNFPSVGLPSDLLLHVFENESFKKAIISLSGELNGTGIPSLKIHSFHSHTTTLTRKSSVQLIKPSSLTITTLYFPALIAVNTLLLLAI